MNSKISKISSTNKLPLSLSEKNKFKKSDKYVALSNLSICYTRENLKNHTKIINLKYQLENGMKNLNYMMDHVLYQICSIILNIS